MGEVDERMSAGYVVVEEVKGKDGEEEGGRDQAWQVTSGFDAKDQEKKTRGVYVRAGE